jgi:hypothetical protein
MPGTITMNRRRVARIYENHYWIWVNYEKKQDLRTLYLRLTPRGSLEFQRPPIAESCDTWGSELIL